MSGFVFKVQANMDPNHRDRVAFLRLASGEFRRNMKLKQSGTGKASGCTTRSCSSPRNARRSTRPGPATSSVFPITACCGWAIPCRKSGSIVFTGIPNFAPEILRRVRLADPMKQKHLARALESLAEEG